MNIGRMFAGLTALLLGGAILQDSRRPRSPQRWTPQGPVVVGVDGQTSVLVLDEVEWVAPLVRMGVGRGALTAMVQGHLEQYTIDLPTFRLAVPSWLVLNMEDEDIEVLVNPARVAKVEAGFFRLADRKDSAKIIFQSGSDLQVVQSVQVVSGMIAGGGR